MVLVQRANKQLRIPEERLKEYEQQGYKRVVPDDSPKFICPVCGKEYRSENALEKHIKKEHTDNSSDDTPEE
ncbi:MAG: hypothetical protein E7547_02855 [Ruminococcaceae bacterium]|nr:hypothetical protein [Oscillospiraceae bacterium]